jgi:sulfate transport system substrate-binding protein
MEPIFVRRIGAIAVTAATALAVTACGSSSSSKRLALVAYSTPQTVYAKLIPAFEGTANGTGWTFTQSYGASGDQSRAVAAGLPADVVALSLAPDVAKLASAGLVSSAWASDRYKGMVTDSIAVIAVRPGNPKHITSFDDLIKPGVKVLTPNPSTSGGARWNILAAYGAELKEGKTAAQALTYLKALFHNVVAQDTSGRNATQDFLSGRGDALITYENEAIGAKKKGAALDYVVPSSTILIENPIAVVARGGHAAEAQRFIDYLRSAAAQTIFAKAGYRPVVPGVAVAASFPKPPGLFTIGYLGGWKAVTKQFFDPTSGLIIKIEQGLGVTTTK